MSKDLIAKAATVIRAPKDRVWEALIAPDAIKQYMFGADVESDWREGSQIKWKGEFNNKKYEDKGVILEIVPGQALQYSHFSPLSGKPDRPENYHTVTITLSESDLETQVTLSQDNNDDEESRRESEQNWTVMLDVLKKYVETSF